MQALILRFDAPLQSFGGDAVDSARVSDRFPRRSLIAGLLANALGYDHAEWDKTQRLQDRLSYAVRCDRSGRPFVDFQTVDLGQEFLRETWTTRGEPEGRAGSVSTGTHIQHRHYLADAIYTVAVGVEHEEQESPTIHDLAKAVRNPERPLFLGRWACIPSSYIYQATRAGKTLFDLLWTEPRLPDRHKPNRGLLEARWPVDSARKGTEVFLTEDRDWQNGIHTGRRILYQGYIDPAPYMTQVARRSCT